MTPPKPIYFFARGLMIVEGDAENILLPSLARILQRDFTGNGVSIVNVGGIGLRRFARIYQRKGRGLAMGSFPFPVACVTDLGRNARLRSRDNRACAGGCGNGQIRPSVAGGPGEISRPSNSQLRATGFAVRLPGRRSRHLSPTSGLSNTILPTLGSRRKSGLPPDLRRPMTRIAAGKVKRFTVAREALHDFVALSSAHPNKEELATHVYAPFLRDSRLSKADSGAVSRVHSTGSV